MRLKGEEYHIQTYFKEFGRGYELVSKEPDPVCPCSFEACNSSAAIRGVFRSITERSVQSD